MTDHRTINDSLGSQPPSRDLLLGLLLGCVVGATIPTVLMSNREQSAPVSLSLSVSRDQSVREEARATADSLTPPDMSPVGFAEFLPQLTPVERRFEQALDKVVTINFTDIPLTEVVTFFADELSVNVILDVAALTEAGIGADTAVTRQVTEITARSALKLLLQPLELTAIVNDEVLKVTTAARANEILITRTYPVSDLCRTANDWQSLIRALIEETSGPWQERDGDGGVITEVEQTGSVIVRQCWSVQQEVLSLIRRQREAQRRMIPAKQLRPNSRGPFPGQAR